MSNRAIPNQTPLRMPACSSSYAAALTVLACLGGTSSAAIANQAVTPPTASRPVDSAATSTSLQQDIADHYELVIGDNTAQARRLGATKLLELGTTDAVARLADVLRTNSPARLPARTAVCEAIAGRENPPSVLLDALIACLGDKSPGMAEALSRALRRFDTALAVERLRPLASDSEAALERRLAAIAALGESGDDIRAVAALATLLDGTSPTIQAAALIAFSTATGIKHDSASAALSWWSRHSTLTGTQWLWRVNEVRREQVRRLQTVRADLNRRVVQLSREAYLSTSEGNRAERLLSFLRDDLPAVRSLGLGLINDLITDRKDIDGDAKSRIVELLSDADPQVRQQAATIAGELRLAGALNRLLDALAVESVPDVRMAQVAALGRLDDPAAVPALIARLTDDALVVVGEAALALGNLARKRPDAVSAPDAIVTAMLERYGRLRPIDEDVREKFIQAMARIGEETFRLEFRRATAPSESLRIRRAAISALAAFGDVASADDARGLLKSQEMEIRQAAVDTLGKCGRRLEDLAALTPHLYARSEADAAVREQAWRAYLAISERIPASDVFRMATEFGRTGDKADQQRSVDLLRSIRVVEARFESLPAVQRFELLSQLADGLAILGDHVGAATSLEQAAALRESTDAAGAISLLARALSARLAALEDGAAIEKSMQLSRRVGGAATQALAAFAEVVLKEAGKRADQAADAQAFSAIISLLDSAAALLKEAGREANAAAIRSRAMTRRGQIIQELLADYLLDGEGEARIIAFGPEPVVPPLASLLEPRGAGSTDRPVLRVPTAQGEQRLVHLARKLVPAWQGLDAATDEAQRAAALNELRSLAHQSEDGRAPADRM